VEGHIRIRLSEEELAAACLLAGPGRHALLDDADGRAALAGLERLGALSEGRLTGAAAEIVPAVVAPRVRVAIDCLTREGEVSYRVWAGEAGGVLGRVLDTGAYDLTRLPPLELPAVLTTAISLRPRPEVSPATPIALAAGLLETLVELVDGGRREEAAGELARAGLGGDPGERLLALVAGRRISWHAASTWTEADGAVAGEALSGMDGGDGGGLWLVEPDGAGTLTLTPTSAEAVAERLYCLLLRPP
jgi:hypothetical protein